MKNYIIYIFIAIVGAACSNAASIDSNMSSNSLAASEGRGGSLARFAIAGNYLYTIDNRAIQVFDISNAENPIFAGRVETGRSDIETIFPYKNNLFLGSQTAMLIYSLAKPTEPTQLVVWDRQQAFASCDPVVADDRYAYTTLRSDVTVNRCRRSQNLLQIIDIQDIKSPKLIVNMPMANPKGLGIDGNLLFLCDQGLKVYDLSKFHSDISNQPVLMQSFPIAANDVIPYRNRLLVTADEGFFQYDYSSSKLELLSKILIEK